MLKRFWPLIIWALLSLTLSSIPGDELPEVQGPFGWDKVIHLVLYLVLGALALRAWAEKRVAPWIIFLFCVGYGVVDEVHQMFIPDRYADVWDWVADSIGAFIGVFGMWLAMRFNPRLAVVRTDENENS